MHGAGYYARFAAFDQLTSLFLQRCSSAGVAAQILSLGAGFDSNFFRLQVGVSIANSSLQHLCTCTCLLTAGHAGGGQGAGSLL